MSGDLIVVMATSRRSAGDGLASACRRRGLIATVMQPHGPAPAGVDVLLLDLSSEDGRVGDWAAFLPGLEARVVALVGQTRRFPATVSVDGWVDVQDPIDRLVDVIRTAARSEAARSIPPADVGLASPLTARERDVLRELLGGGGPAGIGARLGISEHTVRTHIQNAMSKLGLSSRVEAAAWAFRHDVAPAAAEIRS